MGKFLDDSGLSYFWGKIKAYLTDANLSTTDVTTNNASTSKHGFSPKVTAPASGNLSVEGVANGETVRSDKLLLDTTTPSTQAFSDSASAGTSLKAARVDHKHAMPAGSLIKEDGTNKAYADFVYDAGTLTITLG